MFANGRRQSRTIPTFETSANAREVAVLTWILDEDEAQPRAILLAPTLQKLDGASTTQNILRETAAFAQNAQKGERGLLYFTGHGSAGSDGGLFGFAAKPDYQQHQLQRLARRFVGFDSRSGFAKMAAKRRP